MMPHEVHYPHFSNDILFVNLIGTHSCLSILNEDPLLFDDNLVWYMDSDYYKRAYKKFGKPKLLKHPTVIQRLWDGQVTNTLINREIIEKEEFYLNEKYRAGSIII